MDMWHGDDGRVAWNADGNSAGRSAGPRVRMQRVAVAVLVVRAAAIRRMGLGRLATAAARGRRLLVVVTAAAEPCESLRAEARTVWPRSLEVSCKPHPLGCGLGVPTPGLRVVRVIFDTGPGCPARCWAFVVCIYGMCVVSSSSFVLFILAVVVIVLGMCWHEAREQVGRT